METQTKHRSVNIIGGGLAGCSLARLLAEKNYQVTIYELQNHIGGNCYDYYRDNGVLVHKFGPHIFHTDNKAVWDFANRFSKFNNYINQVLVKVDGKLIKMPINFDSIEALKPNDIENFIAEVKRLFPHTNKISIADLLNQLNEVNNKNICQYIYDHVYANYSAKMWGISIDQLDPNIIKRVSINLNREWNYFIDHPYQGLPIEGYTKWINKMVDHHNITIKVNVNGIKNIDNKAINIYTGPIEALFNYRFGALPYRSLKIDFTDIEKTSYQAVAVINYPSHPTMTRICEYKKMTFQENPNTTISKEYPGAYNPSSVDFKIPFYPISNQANLIHYKKYQNLLNEYENLYVLGRLAEYKYYDMDKIIVAAMQLASNIVKNEK